MTQSAGETQLVGGYLVVNGTFLIEQGSTVSGTGSIQATAVVNWGLLSIGSNARPFERLQLTGDYSQETTGEVRFNLGGIQQRQFGRLSVGGKASLSGTLSINLSGYNPQQNDALALIAWGSLDPDGDAFDTTPDGWTADYQNGFLLTKN